MPATICVAAAKIGGVDELQLGISIVEVEPGDKGVVIATTDDLYGIFLGKIRGRSHSGDISVAICSQSNAVASVVTAAAEVSGINKVV